MFGCLENYLLVETTFGTNYQFCHVLPGTNPFLVSGRKKVEAEVCLMQYLLPLLLSHTRSLPNNFLGVHPNLKIIWSTITLYFVPFSVMTRFQVQWCIFCGWDKICYFICNSNPLFSMSTFMRVIFIFWGNHMFHLQDGIEECRKLCGGHGYLCSSGLPELFAVYVPDCTYEGDNTILLLQVCELFRSHLSLANCMPPLLEFPIIYVLLVLPPLPTLIVCCKISLLNYNQRRICNK